MQKYLKSLFHNNCQATAKLQLQSLFHNNFKPLQNYNCKAYFTTTVKLLQNYSCKAYFTTTVKLLQSYNCKAYFTIYFQNLGVLFGKVLVPIIVLYWKKAVDNKKGFGALFTYLSKAFNWYKSQSPYSKVTHIRAVISDVKIDYLQNCKVGTA